MVKASAKAVNATRPKKKAGRPKKRDYKREMEDALQKAESNLVNFRRICLNVDLSQECDPAWFHYRWSDILLNEDSNFAVMGHREALPIDTEIPTLSGFKKISEISVGDKVFNDKGKAVSVNYKSPVYKDKECYKITFDCGISQVCDKDHIWNVYDKNKRKMVNITTEEMFSNYVGWKHKNGYREYRFRLPVGGAVEYPNKDLKIDPYVLGIWLGDGSSADCLFTIGDRDISCIRSEFSKRGHVLNDLKSRDIRYSIRGHYPNFKHYNLFKNKHIPEDYLTAPIQDRKDLLSGLIDSDGTVGKSGTKKGNVSFSNKNKTLIDNVCELVSSLGYKYTVNVGEAKFNGKSYGIYYRVNFKPDEVLSKIKYKQVEFTKSERSRSLTIKSIEKTDSVDCQCIGVEGELYRITRNYITTHNSAKGQLILRAFPLYCLMFPSTKRDFIVLLKQNTEQAEAKLKEISQEYLMNPILSANLVEVHENSGKCFSVDVRDKDGKVINIRFQSFGKGKAIRGLSYGDRRPKIVVADDIQDFDDARSDTIMDNDWDWFISDVKMLGKKTRFFMIGNNLGEGCLMERLKLHHKDLGFDFEVVPAMDEVEKKSNWESMFSYDFLIKEREQYRQMGKLDTWYRERMCLATTEEYRVFKKEDRRYYVPTLHDTLADDPKNRIYVTLDPASSTNKQACFRAIVVNCVNTKGQWFILDVRYGRWDSAELIDEIFLVMRRYKTKCIGIEKGQFKQVIEPFIYKEMSNRKFFFDIKPLEHAGEGSKLERIKMLGPRFKAHDIWFPTHATWLSELEAELDGVTRDKINSRFIDLVDALCMQEQMVERNARDLDVRQLPRKY